MDKNAKYTTKQREAILACLYDLNGGHATAAQIADMLKARGAAVGTATVYRTLDRLERAGLARKFMLGRGSGACYQYLGGDCGEHLHLKCGGCGKTIHLDCDAFGGLARHVRDEHDFAIDAAGTVFVGRCKKCYEGKR